MLNNKQKSYLRSLANPLKAVVIVGKDGLSDTVLESLDVSLEAHELVKVSLLKTCALSVKEAAIELAVGTKSEIIQTIGRTIVFYRRSKEAKIELPETSKTLANNIVYGGVMLILFIGAKIALRLVKAIANLIAKLPIISQFNKLGGALYGILRGTLLIYAVLMVISVAGAINPKNVLHENVSQSTLGKVMYENNVLNIFLK